MNRKNSSILILSLLFILTLAIYSTYAFFVMGNFNINNTANVNLITDENNIVFDVLGGQINLTFNASALKPNDIGNIVAQNTTTLTVNFQPNTTGNIVCSYDIVYEWISSDKYLAHSPGATGNEFTVQATLTNNSNVSEGLNYIQGENDLGNLSWNNSSATVVKNAQIDGSGSTTSTATWTIISKFYNANADQGALAGKSLSGKFNVANVNCKVGTKSVSLVRYLIDSAPKSGTSTVGSTPWILTSDHVGEWRYAGKNPDNYISFNGEAWRIIGVMPNMSYCTGEYGTETECNSTGSGSLIKIVRNYMLGVYPYDYKRKNVGSAVGNGSNDWSDSQLMLMLNGTNYLKTSYDEYGNQLHTSYTISNNIVNGNGYDFYNATYSYLDDNVKTVYIPSEAATSGYTATSGTIIGKIGSSYLNNIATAKWSLYGYPSCGGTADCSPETVYKMERNIDDLGTLYVGNTVERSPAYWYGKIGLVYMSDIGFATNGNGNDTGDYSRSGCFNNTMNAWNSGNYKTYCASNSWIQYSGITYSAPSSMSSYYSLSPQTSYQSSVYMVSSSGGVSSGNVWNSFNVRPVLYLKSDTVYSGSGTGKWNDPYIIE